MNILSASQLNSITKLVESMGESVVFAASVEKQHKRKQRIEKRVLVITDYRIITLRSGLMTGYRLAREGLITNITNISMDTAEKIMVEFTDWGIVFRTLHTEQLLSSLINRYNTISAMIPMEIRAIIQVNPSFLSRNTIMPCMEKPIAGKSDPMKYCSALKAMYSVMCNKYGTQPFTDIEDDLCDRYLYGDKTVVIDSNRRNMDAQQCAAIIETLRYDQWFESVSVSGIIGIDVIIPSFGIVLSINQHIKHVMIMSIKTTSRTLYCLINALSMNTTSPLLTLTLNDLPITSEFIDELVPVLPALVELNLAKCQMNQTVISRLFSMLKQCEIITKHIKMLDISYNALGPDGSIALASWLTESLPIQLTTLNLSGTNAVWTILVESLQKRELHVTNINISSNMIYDKVFSVLNPFFASGHINQLSIGSLKGDMNMIEGLCGSFLLNPTLKSTSLCIDNTAMEYQFQERLISLVAQSYSLEELSLRNCQMDDVCISMLCDVLVKYPTCKLKRLFIDSNLRVPEVGKSSLFLETLMKESTTLEEISISGCHGILVAKIAEGLRASSTIKHFTMNDCGMMDEDVKIICDAVQNHTSLKTLRIDYNNTMVAGFFSICEMLKVNKTIVNMGSLRSLPEIERLFSEDDREKIKSYRRTCFITLMKHAQ